MPGQPQNVSQQQKQRYPPRNNRYPPGIPKQKGGQSQTLGAGQASGPTNISDKLYNQAGYGPRPYGPPPGMPPPPPRMYSGPRPWPPRYPQPGYPGAYPMNRGPPPRMSDPQRYQHPPPPPPIPQDPYEWHYPNLSMPPPPQMGYEGAETHNRFDALTPMESN